MMSLSVEAIKCVLRTLMGVGANNHTRKQEGSSSRGHHVPHSRKARGQEASWDQVFPAVERAFVLWWGRERERWRGGFRTFSSLEKGILSLSLLLRLRWRKPRYI